MTLRCADDVRCLQAASRSLSDSTCTAQGIPNRTAVIKSSHQVHQCEATRSTQPRLLHAARPHTSPVQACWLSAVLQKIKANTCCPTAKSATLVIPLQLQGCSQLHRHCCTVQQATGLDQTCQLEQPFSTPRPMCPKPLDYVLVSTLQPPPKSIIQHSFLLIPTCEGRLQGLVVLCCPGHAQAVRGRRHQ